MLWPLFIIVAAFLLLFLAVWILRIRGELAARRLTNLRLSAAGEAEA
jgi:hypothetical protein